MASPNRTEKPTPKRRRDALKKGEVVRSKEIPGSLVYLTAVIFFAAAGSYAFEKTTTFCRFLWRTSLLEEINLQTAPALVAECLVAVVKLAGPFVLLVLLVSLASSLLQGPVFSTERLKFKPEALNPAKNVKRFISTRGLVEFVKATSIIVVVSYVAWGVLSAQHPLIQRTVFMEIEGITAVLGRILYAISFQLVIFLIVLAGADYLFQKYRHEQDLKQTKQEVRQDMKETEGDPLMKSRIRSLQRELARRRMMEEVKNADVVISNPTHYAVALKYNWQQMAAPRVVAKGRGFVAQRIKEIARQYNVATVENVALAQTLYQSVDAGSEIPASLYKAVAQILAYVYKLEQTHWH